MKVIISLEIMNIWFQQVVNYHCFPHLAQFALKVIVSKAIITRNNHKLRIKVTIYSIEEVSPYYSSFFFLLLAAISFLSMNIHAMRSELSYYLLSSLFLYCSRIYNGDSTKLRDIDALLFGGSLV